MIIIIFSVNSDQTDDGTFDDEDDDEYNRDKYNPGTSKLNYTNDPLS